MHNTSSIISSCFYEVLKTDFVETISCIPGRKNEEYNQCWHLITEIEVNRAVAEVDLYLGFPSSFPYSLPECYYFDSKYDYFPHIDYDNRKLCLYENDIVIDITNPIDVVRSCIKQAKRVLEEGINYRNKRDFIDEIESYWHFSYNGEPNVDITYLIWGNLEETELLNILTDSKKRKMIVSDKDLSDVEKWFKTSISKEKLLYLPNYSVSHEPPYDMDWRRFWSTLDEENQGIIKGFLRKTSTLNILFPLANDYLFGGFCMGLVSTKINGFRSKSITPFKALEICYHKKKMKRISARVYNQKRIEERTCGFKQEHHSFAIVGCGSVGSNLCYFLSAFVDTSFLLVDNDILGIDNIGRHLLGVSDILNSKVEGLKNYLTSKRPEIIVDTLSRNVIKYNESTFNGSTAIFCCTGNYMAELNLITKLSANSTHPPVFILWLEPYAIAGHMIYLSPTDGVELFENLFTKSIYYKHNLIMGQEYDKLDAFVKRDAGCNGTYTNYSGNDVVIFLSAMYPYICNLLENSHHSICYRWVGNIQIAIEKEISLTQNGLLKGQVNIIQTNKLE